MSFTVYHKETTVIPFWKYGSPKRYATAGAAKAALTRESKKLTKPDWRDDKDTFVPRPKINKDDYAVADTSDFVNSIEKKRTVKNLLSGIEFEEAVNTPGYLSPSTETYHCS